MILKKRQTNRRGFTLIELLVVIAIIAILATVGIVTYSNTQHTSRDAKRKQDMQTIATALELFHQQNGRYPKARYQVLTLGEAGPWSASEDNIISSSTPWVSNELTTAYISSLPPKDPTNSGAFGYFYITGGSNPGWSNQAACNTNAQKYVLWSTLENKNDPQANTSLVNSFQSCSGNYPTFDPTSNFLYAIVGN